MNILNIGTDSSVLNEQSSLFKRILDYSAMVNKYYVIVPAKNSILKKVSDKITLYGVSGFAKPVVLIKIYQLLKKILKNDFFDVISVQDQYYLALACYLVSSKTKTALEIQVHGYEKYSGIRKMISRFVLGKADSIRTVSDRIKNEMIKNGISEEKISVIPIFTEISNSQVAVAGDNNKFIFLTAARLVPVKNISLQLAALALLQENHKNIELWIAGDGPDVAKLKAESKKLEVEEMVKFLGWQANLDKYYNSADAFLLTSYSEGWPLVINEAAARGLAIIMTDVGSAGKLIVNNESGLVIPIDDGDALVAAMKKIILDKELRLALGQKAKENFNKLPDKQQTLAMYKKSWEMAVNNK